METREVLSIAEDRVKIKYNPFRASYEVYVDGRLKCRNWCLNLAKSNAKAFAEEL